MHSEDIAVQGTDFEENWVPFKQAVLALLAQSHVEHKYLYRAEIFEFRDG